MDNLLAQFTDVARRKAELDQLQSTLQPQVDQLKRQLDEHQQRMNEVTVCAGTFSLAPQTSYPLDPLCTLL